MNECTAQLADSTIIVTVGPCAWGHAAIYCFCVCGTSPLSAQCNSIVVQVHSDFGSLCIQNWVL